MPVAVLLPIFGNGGHLKFWKMVEEGLDRFLKEIGIEVIRGKCRNFIEVETLVNLIGR